MAFRVEIQGDQELVRRLDKKNIGPPLREFFRDAGEFVEREGRSKAVGSYATTIGSPRIDSAPLPGFAEVRSSHPAAKAIEGGSRPHFPPVRSLEDWARSRGIEPFLVARAISRTGTKPKPALLAAQREAESRMRSQWLPKLGQAIVRALGGP